MTEASFIFLLAIISHTFIFFHYEKVERARDYEKYKLNKEIEELKENNKKLLDELNKEGNVDIPKLKINKITKVDVNPEDLIDL
jgi:hypothetical protein